MSVVHATGREVPKNNAPDSLHWSDILRLPLYILNHPIQASTINHRLKVTIEIGMGFGIRIAIGYRFWLRRAGIQSRYRSRFRSSLAIVYSWCARATPPSPLCSLD